MKTKNKLLTIITVVKNDVINIERTIRSITQQKDQYIEYLIIDGKSSDGTLQKINNSGNMNNGTINNTINIMALGQENIDEVLSKTDKIAILNKKENALPYMIEMVHFNDKYPQFKNIAITNNRTKQAYLYDTINKVFKMVIKKN